MSGALRVLVTGSASGLGGAILEHYAAAGAVGVGLDVTAAAPADGDWRTAAVDVTDHDALGTAIRGELTGFGGVDVVVAAAGIVPAWRPTGEIDLAAFDRTMAVNVRGVVSTIEHVTPLLSDGGAIVVVGSVASWQGDPNNTAYVASKHAVLGVVRSAARSLGPRGIRVNAVGPGPVATAALVSRVDARAAAGGPSRDEALRAMASGTALQRLASIDDVVGAVAFLASGAAGGISGHLLPVDGGIG